jgi:hypothetical protein
MNSDAFYPRALPSSWDNPIYTVIVDLHGTQAIPHSRRAPHTPEAFRVIAIISPCQVCFVIAEIIFPHFTAACRRLVVPLSFTLTLGAPQRLQSIAGVMLDVRIHECPEI